MASRAEVSLDGSARWLHVGWELQKSHASSGPQGQTRDPARQRREFRKSRASSSLWGETRVPAGWWQQEFWRSTEQWPMGPISGPLDRNFRLEAGLPVSHFCTPGGRWEAVCTCTLGAGSGRHQAVRLCLLECVPGRFTPL
jgi:hypothetical protein